MAPLVSIALRISGATSTVVLSGERIDDVKRAMRSRSNVQLSDAVTILKSLDIDVKDRTGRDKTRKFDLYDLKDKHHRRIINVILERDTYTNNCHIREIPFVEEKPVEIKGPEPKKQLDLF